MLHMLNGWEDRGSRNTTSLQVRVDGSKEWTNFSLYPLTWPNISHVRGSSFPGFSYADFQSAKSISSVSLSYAVWRGVLFAEIDWGTMNPQPLASLTITTTIPVTSNTDVRVCANWTTFSQGFSCYSTVEYSGLSPLLPSPWIEADFYMGRGFKSITCSYDDSALTFRSVLSITGVAFSVFKLSCFVLFALLKRVNMVLTVD